ncbi:MAG: heavy-metal-associated domain-containing protein [Phycisphaerales bacterium]|nr:heavy-metal-associated domain-containing protein [Phycisphaerales bacterium]
MKRIRLSIDGMTCGHCSKSVHDALMSMDGVRSCDVRLEANCADLAVVSAVEISAIAEKVADAGYRLIGFSPLRSHPASDGEAS